MQVAVKKPTEILHEHSIGTEERTNAKTSNVDKMTAKQLFSDHSESHTFGAESWGLGTAAVAASIGVGSDASDSDDDALRSRPVKKRAAGADRACEALVFARSERVDDGRCERQSTRTFSRCTPRKTDAKGDYSLCEDDKDEHEEFPEFLGGGLAKFYDFRTGFVKFFESERDGRSPRMRVRGEASSISQPQGCGEVAVFRDLRVEDQGQHFQATFVCQGEVGGCCVRSRGLVGSNRGHEQAEVRKDASAEQSEQCDEWSHEKLKESLVRQISGTRHKPRQAREAGGPSGI